VDTYVFSDGKANDAGLRRKSAAAKRYKLPLAFLRCILAKMLAMQRKKITVNMHEAKSTLSRLIEAAEKGAHVIIARDGNPVVELVPVRPRAGRQPGTHPELQVGPEFFAPLSEEELQGWEGNL
jgi:prevent-host-death family protein